MSRPVKHYAILKDGYPYGITSNNRFLRTYKTRESAKRSAEDLTGNELTSGLEPHTYEVVRIDFVKENRA